MDKQWQIDKIKYSITVTMNEHWQHCDSILETYITQSEKASPRIWHTLHDIFGEVQEKKNQIIYYSYGYTCYKIIHRKKSKEIINVDSEMVLSVGGKHEGMKMGQWKNSYIYQAVENLLACRLSSMSSCMLILPLCFIIYVYIVYLFYLLNLLKQIKEEPLPPNYIKYIQ